MQNINFVLKFNLSIFKLFRKMDKFKILILGDSSVGKVSVFYTFNFIYLLNIIYVYI